MATPRKIFFKSLNLTLVGNLYLPSKASPDRKWAAIVIGHPFTAVKEQTAGLYAENLANQGFITLAFDAAYGGESAGYPRGLENPMQRAEDVRAAVTYLQTLEFVDPERIGAVGICASGGYVPFAAQTDTRIKAVATISAICNGRWSREGLLPSEPVTRQALQETLNAANRFRLQEYTGEEKTMATLFPEDDEIRSRASTVTREGYDFYKGRGYHERSSNKFMVASASLLANYDSYHLIKMISPRPILMIVGSEADTAYISKDAITKADEPKELFTVSGKTHLGLYEDLSETVPKLVNFYSEYLLK